MIASILPRIGAEDTVLSSPAPAPSCTMRAPKLAAFTRRGERLAEQRVDDHVDAPIARPARAPPPDPRCRPAAPRRRRRAPGSAAAPPASALPRPRGAAPSDLAACTAICPSTPLAPSTSTCSPGLSSARHVSASHAASPDIPSATATPSSTPSGTSYAACASISVRSAIEPYGAIGVSKYTRLPSSTPTPSRPATDGSGGAPA